ncbi:hypothetical protein Ancab_040027 [Ancistrocladus abbreviatus]
MEELIGEEGNHEENQKGDIHASNPTPSATGTEDHDDIALKKKKRLKTSKVWSEFNVIELSDKTKKAECIHCKKQLFVMQTGSTTHLNRHLEACVCRRIRMAQQKKINFLPSSLIESQSEIRQVSALHDGVFDMMRMRESVAHWILMHEHSVSIVEEEGFNLMMKCGMPQWQKISHQTIREDCYKVYELQRKKLKSLLMKISNISLTTDLWYASPQKIEYMVLTGHFVDSNWMLQKHVLSFVHIPLPRRGVEIADCIYKCLKEWGIENKVFTVSVDNASANDVCIRYLKDTFSKTRKLVCGGKLFHVRCYAHIFNIMVQYGLQEIKHVIENIRESVVYINGSESRMQEFCNIVEQLKLPHRRLVIDCRTRWNSTYEMLACAMRFKDVFSRYSDRDVGYLYCPSLEDWEKVEKVCEILEVFNDVTDVVSDSDYPTSNMFLNEVYRVKVLLDEKSHSEDVFIRDMVGKMKEKFDKYWGEYNLLMAIAAVLDPRCKMKVIEFTFSQMFPENEARQSIEQVKKALYELYGEYVNLHNSKNTEPNKESESSGSIPSETGRGKEKGRARWSRFMQFVKSTEAIQPHKSDVDVYLEEGLFICEDDSDKFNVLDWWRGNELKYWILSKMAANILAIPISTVASEATFSTGSRVLDPYRASLSSQTVQVLLCGGD